MDLPILTDVEVRVLGSLIEKSITTPEYYPLTLNSLTTACNQKSSRKPIVEYDENTIVSALNQLKAISIIATAVGGSSRSTKYKHNFTTVFPLTNAELAILCLLFLRGPLTPGEINSNSGRLHSFQSLESVNETLQQLSHHTPCFVKELPKQPGQKEARFIHLLCPYHAESEMEPEMTFENKPAKLHQLEERVSQLEKELFEVKEKIDKLMKDVLGE